MIKKLHNIKLLYSFFVFLLSWILLNVNPNIFFFIPFIISAINWIASIPDVCSLSVVHLELRSWSTFQLYAKNFLIIIIECSFGLMPFFVNNGEDYFSSTLPMIIYILVCFSIFLKIMVMFYHKTILDNNTPHVHFMPFPIPFLLPLQDHYATDQTCSICFEKGNLSISRCNHLFHQNCIQTWVSYGHVSCPICRGNLLRAESGV